MKQLMIILLIVMLLLVACGGGGLPETDYPPLEATGFDTMEYLGTIRGDEVFRFTAGSDRCIFVNSYDAVAVWCK